MPAERSMGIPRYLFFAAFVIGLGGALFGYDTTVISGAILYIKTQFDLSPDLEETVVSVAVLGALLGAATSGPLADRFGRRRMLLATAAMFLGGALCTALAPNVASIIAGRIVIGVAIGTVSVVGPLFLSEVASDNLRGRVVGIFMVLNMIGALCGFLIDFAFAGSGDWRIMLGLSAVAALLFGAGMWVLPESPRWHVRKGQIEMARRSLARFRPAGAVDSELQRIRESAKAGGSAWAALLQPAIRPAIIIGIGLGFFQRMTGIDTAFFYAPTIFESASFGGVSIGILAGVGVGTALVLGQLIGMALVDHAGRRPLLLAGIFGGVLSMGLLGLAFTMPAESIVAQWMGVAGIVLFAACWTVGPATVTFLMISELYPLSVRGLGMSIATVALWGTFLLSSQTFLTLENLIGRSGLFWSYAVVGGLAIAFVVCLVPETKGKSLEEIEASWR
ncbi:MAG: sugar porter family MFS transporter [Alphaproteobacteria bacterium]|nr:sugar porter family MFS transporter [Alphaproteobacteria bacterium]